MIIERAIKVNKKDYVICSITEISDNLLKDIKVNIKHYLNSFIYERIDSYIIVYI
jgi:hypothetical protein